MLNELFQTKVNLMESVMKDTKHTTPKHTKPSQSDGTPSTNQPAPHYAHSSFTCQWELPATAVLLTHLYCNLLLYQTRKCLWLYLLIHLGPKHELNGWSIFVFQYFSWWKYFWSFTLLIVVVVESTLSALSGHCKPRYVADMSSGGGKWWLLVEVVVVLYRGCPYITVPAMRPD